MPDDSPEPVKQSEPVVPLKFETGEEITIKGEVFTVSGGGNNHLSLAPKGKRTILSVSIPAESED